MKARYLVQIETNNLNLGATGWVTLNGAMTKAAADDLAIDYRDARSTTNTHAVRVISAANFTKEHAAANRAAMARATQ